MSHSMILLLISHILLQFHLFFKKALFSVPYTGKILSPSHRSILLPETDMRERVLKPWLSVRASGWKHLFFLAPVKHTSSEVPNPAPQQVSICLKVAGAVQICNSEGVFLLICWFWHHPYRWFNEPTVINRITDPRGLILRSLIHWRVTVTMVNNCLKSKLQL